MSLAYFVRWLCAAGSIAVLPLYLLGSAGVAVATTRSSVGDAGLFERLDVNHDGVVATDEVTEANRSLFDRLLRKSDSNHDQKLSREEFLASLVPSRPERPVEAKQSTDEPQANAVRYMLLKLDVNQNARLEKDEIPKQLQPIFELISERLDGNKNGQLERQELSRSGPALAQMASRYVEREGIDVKSELAKLEKAQGAAASRFDDTGGPQERLADPAQARQLFKEMDENGDGYLDKKEMSEVFRERADRFATLADRDRDGRLSQTEFLDGAERVSRFLGRQMKEERKAQTGKSPSGETK